MNYFIKFNYNLKFLKLFNFCKIKVILIICILFFYFIKKDLYYYISYYQNNFFFNEKNIYINNYLSLREKPFNKKDPLIIEEKEKILKLISNTIGKNIKFLDSIFYTCDFNFGNLLINLNKLIYYCEIIGCKLIILDRKAFWFIKNKINIKKYGITITVDDKEKYNNSFTIYYNSGNIFYSFFVIKPEIRIHILKNEIIKNLPKFDISPENLYIHIRSGDIFNGLSHSPYAQPPLCFYESILDNFKFNKVYLISQDKSNPVINKLINKYNSHIIYEESSIKDDISKLMNAYNIVCSISSFLNSIIQLNNNLSILYEFNIYKMIEKIRQYHYDLYKFPQKNFTILRMESSYLYKSMMYNWKNNKKQKKLMNKYKCLNDFSIIHKQNF